jgi:hypothetical protein
LAECMKNNWLKILKSMLNIDSKIVITMKQEFIKTS